MDRALSLQYTIIACLRARDRVIEPRAWKTGRTVLPGILHKEYYAEMRRHPGCVLGAGPDQISPENYSYLDSGEISLAL